MFDYTEDDNADRGALNSSELSEWRKDEIQARIDRRLYPEKPSISELIKHIKDTAQRGLNYFDEAGYQVKRGVQLKKLTDNEIIALNSARECLRVIFNTIQDERFNESTNNTVK